MLPCSQRSRRAQSSGPVTNEHLSETERGDTTFNVSLRKFLLVLEACGFLMLNAHLACFLV